MNTVSVQLSSYGVNEEYVIMGVDHEWLSILCCPDTKQRLSLVDEPTLMRVNQAVARGILVNSGQKLVSEQVEGGLIRADRKILYPIRENIPVLLVEEGIPLDQLG